MREIRRFQEADYRFGTGVLILRVEHVDWGSPDVYDGEAWYRVDGVRLSSTGVELGACRVMVRGRRLQL